MLIAGGGIAAAEAALALRAFAGDRARIEILAPGETMVLAPTAPAAAFDGGSSVEVPLSRVAETAGATLRRGALAEVDAAASIAITRNGERISFSDLIVAVGARRVSYLDEPVLTFRGPEDVPAFQRLLDVVENGALRDIETRLAVVIPPGPGWPLPAYELVLQASERLSRAGIDDMVPLSLVTAEEAPLAAFGPRAGEVMAADLAAAGVAVWTSAVLTSWTMGQLHLVSGASVDVDRVVSLPSLRGPGLPGLPSDPQGFIRTDAEGRVADVDHVFAVGDAGAFPLKQGGIACQQADTVASLIARERGAKVEPVPFEPVLRGVVETSEMRRYLRVDIGGGHDESAGVTSTHDPLWWPPGKVAGRFLAPFLAGMPLEWELADLPAPPPTAS